MTFDCKFGKRRPFSKFFHWQIPKETYHLTLTMLLHYLSKV